jgi:hypothetical protein
MPADSHAAQALPAPLPQSSPEKGILRSQVPLTNGVAIQALEQADLPELDG